MEVLVIRDRIKSISCKKIGTVGKGGGIWSEKGDKDELRLSVSSLTMHCVLCHLCI